MIGSGLESTIAPMLHGVIKLMFSAQVAQSAERTLGKGEVAGSSPVLGFVL